MTDDSAERQAEVAALLMKHRTDLYAYLLAALRNHHDAEDVLQEVALAASRSADQYRPGTDFRAWAREISRRRMLDFVRHRNRRAALLEPEVLESLESAARDAERDEPASDLRDALRECIRKLEGAARRAVALRYGSSMKVGGIAETLGRSVQATYALLKRTRQTLRSCAEQTMTRGTA